MADAFIGEVRIFPYYWAPRDWAVCNGQTIPIKQNTALFAVLGTTFGGDGVNTFALPNLDKRVVVGAGASPSVGTYKPGQSGGVNKVPLGVAQMPSHSHFAATTSPRSTATTNMPGPTMALSKSISCNPYLGSATTAIPVKMAATAISPAGAAVPAAHGNLMPCLAVTFGISLYGERPIPPE